MLHSELSVIDPSGKKVLGRVELGYGEMSWAFFPEQPWRPGDYRLAIGSLLEDLAGNRINRPFEVDIFERVEERITTTTVSLPFRIFPR